MKTLETALQVLSLDLPLVIVPPNEKGPLDSDWQAKRLTADEVRRRFENNPALNIGLVLGPQSYIDVECDSEEALENLKALGISTETPSWRSKRGPHFLFKWDERLAGLGATKTLLGIEFRLGADGKGAQSLLPPSTTDGCTREWILPLTIAAACLPEVVIEMLVASIADLDRSQSKLDPRRPGDDFCLRATWEDILLPHEWIVDGEHWKRPGKAERGLSATTVCRSIAGRELLYVFSTNAAPFESGKGYNKFSAYALLNHGGDFCAAAAALQEAGYGARDLKSAAKAVGAIWTGKAATCHTFEQGRRLAASFGFDLPEIPDRPINFRHQDATTIVVEVDRKKDESYAGWGIGYRKLVLTFPVDAPEARIDLENLARHVITAAREDAGWLIYADGHWNFESRSNVRDFLSAHGFEKVQSAMGQLAGSPYILVNEPFEPPFLDGRQWNKFGAQLAVQPSYGGNHPHYDLIFRHVGAGLDAAVAADLDCQGLGIASGCHYLRLWAASLFQQPKKHLPLLFLYSREQDSAGKSSLQRSLALLLKTGVVEGVRMLREQFNRDMAGAVLCYLEEEAVDGKHAQKVKTYIDADNITIRMMRTDAFMFPNYSHWVASYNHLESIPITEGDQRIVLWEVDPIPEDQKIDWPTLRKRLESEAADFLGTLLSLPLTPSCGRLYLPVLETALKDQVMGCDYSELVNQIVRGFRRNPAFFGTTTELGDMCGLEKVGHLRRKLRKAAHLLLEEGIRVSFPNERKVILEKA